MANTSERLTADTRKHIVDCMIRHRFGDEIDKLVSQRADLALAIYIDVFPRKIRDQMNVLPDGWLPTSNNITVNIQGHYTSLYFSGKFNFGSTINKYITNRQSERMRFPTNKLGRAVKNYGADTTIAQRYAEIRAQEDILEEQVVTAHHVATKVVNSVRTTGRLVEIWPEVKPFLPPPSKKQNNLLPAVPVETLNETFRLPVKK